MKIPQRTKNRRHYYITIPVPYPDQKRELHQATWWAIIQSTIWNQEEAPGTLLQIESPPLLFPREVAAVTVVTFIFLPTIKKKN
jgi:hypothetical protein